MSVGPHGRHGAGAFAGGGGATSPTNSVAPVASGTVTIGGTLSTTNGTWGGSPAPSFAYQWKRAGVAIAAATASSYTPVAADIGPAITCTVTATSPGGSASATSNSLTYAPATALAAKLKIWFNADSQYITLTSGKVSTWTDVITGYTVTQGTAGSRPAIVTVSGKDFVDFDGTDDFLASGTNLSTPLGSTADAEGWATIIPDALPAATGYSAAMLIGTQGSQRLSLSVGTKAYLTVNFQTEGDKSATSAVQPAADGTTCTRVRGSHDNATTIRAKSGSGAEGTTSITHAQTTTNYGFVARVGINAGDTNPYNGRIRHIMVFVGELTTAQRADLDAYLGFDFPGIVV